jgi:mRNA-degrading endonuclease RelE of RelBE toxin-antitoxin system
MKEKIDNLSKIEYIIKRYTVRITHKALKKLDKMPKPEQEKFFRLKTALETRGPEQPSFMNYSKLGMNMYHCHLSRKWVACWKNESGTLTIEVYYVGSRESAPYARH